MYGPDVTFLGVPRVSLDALREMDIVFLGAPFDSGTSHRPGARFGPQAIRTTDYLPHDASRPHLALGVDPLVDLRVGDAGDVVMPPGSTVESLSALDEAVTRVSAAGALPVILGGDHTVTFPDATGVARHVGWGRLSLIHFDAHADTTDTQFGSLYGHGTPMRRLIESGAVRGDRFLQIGLRGYWSFRWPGSTWWRWRRHTTTPKSPHTWRTGWCWRRCQGSRGGAVRWRASSRAARTHRCSRVGEIRLKGATRWSD